MAEDARRPRQCLFLPNLRHFREALWSPPADVYRTADGWLVKLELAGVRPEEVTVEASGRRLTVRGCRRDSSASAGHSHYLMEISYSCFERSIELPYELERLTIDTEYRDGMLLVHIRTEAAK